MGEKEWEHRLRTLGINPKDQRGLNSEINKPSGTKQAGHHLPFDTRWTSTV